MRGSGVSIEGVSKSFGNHTVISNVSLQINPGEFFSLLGPSGCGKTTLLRLIAGFEDPFGGEILLDGTSVLGKPPNKRHVNTVFQSYALFPHLSVFENVAFSLRLKKSPQALVEARVGEYQNLVKLSGERHKKPSQLSGGQKQRVAIARALINEPSVLLLDEPLSALDAKLRQHMLIELDAIHDTVGITFIYVTHDQQEALSVSDRVAVMNEGRICQVGTPADIYERPSDEFVARFIGENNFFRGRVTGAHDESHVCIAIEGIGTIIVPAAAQAPPGTEILATIRPEKIHISHSIPPVSRPGMNIVKGRVDEIIYGGYLSKFFIDTGGAMIRVFAQQSRFLHSDRPIACNDEVTVWWAAEDGVVIKG